MEEVLGIFKRKLKWQLSIHQKPFPRLLLVLADLLPSQQFADKWNQKGTSGEELGGGWLPKLWQWSLNASHLSLDSDSKQNRLFVPAASRTPALMKLHVTLLFLFDVSKKHSPVLHCSSSWQLISLTTGLKQADLEEWGRATWSVIFFVFIYKPSRCLPRCAVPASSEQRRAVFGNNEEQDVWAPSKNSALSPSKRLQLSYSVL